MNERSTPIEKREDGKAKWKRELISWLKTILGAVVLYLILTQLVLVNVTVPTGSMIDTIEPGDRVMAFRVPYYFGKPQQGDIVVFHNPDNEQELYIKRIIAQGGQTVEGIDGVVYVDGVALEEPYITGVPTDSFGPFEVPEDCYFMMGDNRNDSRDSRYWDNPYVERGKILGKAYFRYYPSFSLLS